MATKYTNPEVAKLRDYLQTVLIDRDDLRHTDYNKWAELQVKDPMKQDVYFRHITAIKHKIQKLRNYLREKPYLKHNRYVDKHIAKAVNNVKGPLKHINLKLCVQFVDDQVRLSFLNSKSVTKLTHYVKTTWRAEVFPEGFTFETRVDSKYEFGEILYVSYFKSSLIGVRESYAIRNIQLAGRIEICKTKQAAKERLEFLFLENFKKKAGLD